MRKHLCVAFAALVSLSQVSGQDDKNLPKLEGTWATTTLTYDGKDFEKLKIKFVFKGTQIVVEGSDSIKREYARLTFKLDSSTKPPLMDLTVAEGAQKDTTFEGIYELKDGELRICCKIIGNERPTEFAAPAGSSNAFLILKKE